MALGYLTGYAKLAYCDVISASAVTFPALSLLKGEPAVQWLTLAAAGLMTLLALSLFSAECSVAQKIGG